MLALRLARKYRYKIGKASRFPCRAYLGARGRLIPFLRPYWTSEEIEAGWQWCGVDLTSNLDEVEALEAHFLDTMRQDGVAVATSSGRTALHLALRALRQERADRNQVIVPTYSCRALLDPIVQCDLTPVFADIGDDLNLTEASVVPHLCAKTLAVVVEHLGGKYTTEVEAIRDRAQQSGAVVIEDLCQALGGRYENGHWGSTAPMAIYSFGLGKNLMATGGGMLVARKCLDSVHKEKLNLGYENPASVRSRFAYLMSAYQRIGFRMLWPLRHMPASAFESAYGYNRISSLDLRLIRYQLTRMDEILSARQRNAGILLTALRNLPAISVPGRNGPNVWTKFTLLADTAEATACIRSFLHKAGVETETMYTPLHLRDCGRQYSKGALPMSESIYERAFNLPVRPSLLPQQIAYVAKVTQRAILARCTIGD